ncbi:MAG: hypothetical protein RIF32_10755 [Leptospirales bacterium]
MLPLLLIATGFAPAVVFAQNPAPQEPPGGEVPADEAPKAPVSPTKPAPTAPEATDPPPANPRPDPAPAGTVPLGGAQATTPQPAPQPARERPRPIRERPPVVPEPSPEAAPTANPAPPPADAPAPVPVAQGMADELPAFDRELLPEYEKLQSPPREFPHLLDDGRQTAAPEPDGSAQNGAGEVGNGGGGDGRGWFARLYDSIWADRTVRNGIFVIALILIFIVFRLRNGRGRKGYL